MEKLSRGICRLSIVPVRSEASEKSEMVTQLLFGDHYTVFEISKDNKWGKINITFDEYQGWIDLKQHTEISEEYFDHLNNTEFKIATDLTSTILYKKQLIQIVIGSILPISSNELFAVSEQFAFNGGSKNLGQKQGYEYLKQVIRLYMNAPYLWGGKTPFGIDCSGLTQQIFKLCGYKLKRDASQQFHMGEKISSLEYAKPGDLAFFENDQNKISHVGILTEEQGIIHSSGCVRNDMLDERGIYNRELSAHTHKLVGIRRIFKE